MTTNDRKLHVLVVTKDCCNVKYRIECPGVTDECAAETLCSNREADAALDTGEEFGEAHGVRHRHFDPWGWVIPSGKCVVVEQAISAADDLIDEKDLGAGRYPVDFEGNDDGGLRLYLQDGAPWNRQEAATQ